jgi:hypothetical protein
VFLLVIVLPVSTGKVYIVFTTEELVAYFKAKSQADFGIARLVNFTNKDRYYPIPFDEYKLDPVKMYQNLGY